MLYEQSIQHNSLLHLRHALHLVIDICSRAMDSSEWHGWCGCLKRQGRRCILVGYIRDVQVERGPIELSGNIYIKPFSGLLGAPLHALRSLTNVQIDRWAFTSHQKKNHRFPSPEIMSPIDMVPHPPTSPRPSETPPGSPSHTPPNSPRVHGSSRVDSIERFEHAIEKLTQALKKVEAKTKREVIESNPTKNIEAEKPKTRASKLEYKLVDEVYVPCSMATIVLTSPVKLGQYHIEVQDCGFVRAPRSGDGSRRACISCSRSNR